MPKHKRKHSLNEQEKQGISRERAQHYIRWFAMELEKEVYSNFPDAIRKELITQTHAIVREYGVAPFVQTAPGMWSRDDDEGDK